MQTIQTNGILFLGEQDGPAEKALKAGLTHTFRNFPSIKVAYLVRTSYAETPGINISLCLRGGSERALDVVKSVGAVFKSIFKATEHLDTVFLTEEQLIPLAKVATPFYKPSN